MDLVEILVPFFFFAFTFGSIYIYVMSNHKEKMALIERGAEADKFYHRKSKNTFLRFGFLLIGGGFGFILGLLISNLFHSSYSEGVILASSLLFSGIFIILSYIFEQKYLNKYEMNSLSNQNIHNVQFTESDNNNQVI